MTFYCETCKAVDARRCICKAMKRDGERVTTGSEPRRTFTLVAGRWRANGLTWEVVNGPAPTERERVEVVEVVESGHDEQNLAQSRPDAIGQSKVWDARTVAAVVEEVRNTPSEWVRRVGLSGLAHQLEERFKPSAPGGDDGH